MATLHGDWELIKTVIHMTYHISMPNTKHLALSPPPISSHFLDVFCIDLSAPKNAKIRYVLLCYVMLCMHV